MFQSCSASPSVLNKKSAEEECMRYLSVLTFVLLAISTWAGEKQTAASLSFELPKSHAWDMKSTLKCTSLARVALHQNTDPYKRDKLVAEAGAATDKLELTLVGDVLLMRVGERGTDRYKVVGNTEGFLSAVLVGGMIPAVDSIVIHKGKGLVVWSINEPADVFTDVPYGEMVYLTCK